jgi:bifunctional non-homologous end joining protein LigD
MGESIRVVEIDGRRLTLTNLDRVLWPDDGYTRLDLLEYYQGIAPHLMPCLADRPVAVVLAPGGLRGEAVYHGQAMPGLPAWINVRRIRSDTAPAGHVSCLVGTDRATLSYLVNLGCVSFHQWNATFNAVDRPCELRFDLDAVELPFRDVRAAAFLVRELLVARGLRSWVKTSGGTGLHIMVPLEGKESGDRVLAFASTIARQAVARAPRLFTLEMRRNRRRDSVLVDIHRNPRGSTLISAYSVRTRPGAPGSMPLEWPELERNIYPEEFHITNAAQRIAERGDPLAEFFRSPQRLDLTEDLPPTRRGRGGPNP